MPDQLQNPLLTPPVSPTAASAVAALFAQTGPTEKPVLRCAAVAQALREAGVPDARVVQARPHTTGYGPGEDRPLFFQSSRDHPLVCAVRAGGRLWNADGPTSWGAMLAENHPSGPLQESDLRWATTFQPLPFEDVLQLDQAWPVLSRSGAEASVCSVFMATPEAPLMALADKAMETVARSSGSMLAWAKAVGTLLTVRHELPTDVYVTTRTQAWPGGLRTHVRTVTLEMPDGQGAFAALGPLPVGGLFSITSARPGWEYHPAYEGRVRLAHGRWWREEGNELLEQAAEAAALLYPTHLLKPSRPRARI